MLFGLNNWFPLIIFACLQNSQYLFSFFLWLNNVSIKLYWVFICFIIFYVVLMCCYGMRGKFVYELSDTDYNTESYRILGKNTD